MGCRQLAPPRGKMANTGCVIVNIISHYPCVCRHRRTGQHPFGGGGGKPSFARMHSVGGGGVVADIFRGPYSVGGGVVPEMYP